MLVIFVSNTHPCMFDCMYSVCIYSFQPIKLKDVQLRCKASLESLNGEFENLLKKVHILKRAPSISDAVMAEIQSLIAGLTERKIKAVKTAQRLIQGSSLPKPNSVAKSKAKAAPKAPAGPA